jgi:hypothetical protein
MLRKIVMLFPVLAFTLPLVAISSAMAWGPAQVGKPVGKPVWPQLPDQVDRPGVGCVNPCIDYPDPCVYDPCEPLWPWTPVGGAETPHDVTFASCINSMINIYHRDLGGADVAFECDILTGPNCFANCAGEDEATCRSQCEDGGAMFCWPAEGEVRFGPNPHVLFIDAETCQEIASSGSL